MVFSHHKAGSGRARARRGACAAVLALIAGATIRADATPAPPIARLSYADLVDLADAAPLVLRAQIRGQALVAKSGGTARVYFEAAPLAALSAAPLPAVPRLRYLADVPLDLRGRVPSLNKAVVLLFARPAPPRAGTAPGELQLVAPDAQLPDDPALETRVARVVAQLAAPDAPGPISAVREAIYTPGTLAGEGETQIFLATHSGTPASISVERRPGASPRWTASFSEVVDASGLPPAHDTLAWYRLACFLPAVLPPAANIGEDAAARTQAMRDYAFVRADLGPCTRERG